MREALLEPRNQIEEILERQVRMQTSHDVELGNRFRVARSGRLESLFQGHGVSARRVFLAAKSAQPAGGNADIRGINMAIDVEISLVAVQKLASVIR